jgi:hypothetical protein
LPRAHIVVINQATGFRLETSTDTNGDNAGQAVVHLDQGTYELKVWVAGFKPLDEKQIEIKADTHRDVILTIDNVKFCTVFCFEPAPYIPLELQSIEEEISLIPAEQFIPPAKPLRHRHASASPNHP